MEAVAYRLEKFATGRFDVLAENGMRLGSIIGGGISKEASWCAEIGNRTLGYFRTRAKAAEMILAERGIKALYVQMKEIIEGPDGLLTDFINDFYVVDKNVIEGWKCATSLVWVIRPYGTHLVQLDCPFTEREGTAILEAVHPDVTGQPWRLYHIDVTDLKVKEIALAKAQELVRQRPRYDIKGNFVTLGGQAIADIEIRGASHLMHGSRAHIVIRCQRAPADKELPLLARLGFYALRLQQHSMFAAPESLEVFFEKKCLYLWHASKG